jgi:3-carboxy-cis,cis-muconate cycloisomerase
MLVTSPIPLLDPLFTTDAMRTIFSDHARVQRFLDFEAALARAQARVGVIPKAAVAPIESQCRAESFNIDAIARATALAGNPVIPLVKELTDAVARRDQNAAGFVHWGATSQDVMDTALVLQLRAALDLIESDMTALSEALAHLAETHKRTPMAGRTWLQQALPVTLGLKAAGWLSAIERHRARLHELRARALVLQFGGAAGTLAAFGDRGLDVVAALAEELKLAVPDLPWHAQRDRVAEAATALGLIVGTLGKIARDISLMMQTEVAEAFEPMAAGRGGSSTLPHKRNPVGAAVVLAAATRVPPLVSTMLTAMVQEHERGLGGWHAEWETLPEICMLAGGALAHTREVVVGLDIHAPRLRENLQTTRGLIYAEAVAMALGKHIGRQAAHALVEQACQRAAQEARHLRDVLAEDATVKARLSATELSSLFEPENYLGSAEILVDRVLAKYKKNK